MAKDIELAKAEAQLLGYKHAKNGFTLISLIDSMGLTFDEWEELKKEYDLTYLSKDEKQEIDLFFGAINMKAKIAEAYKKNSIQKLSHQSVPRLFR